MTKKYERHPLSAVYGEIDPDMFIRLQASMMATGFDKDEPVLLYEGKVLDGWNRYRAAEGVCEVVFKQFTGTLEEAKALVRRKNYRRNLTAGQLVALEVEVEDYRPPVIDPGLPPAPRGRTDKQIAEDIGTSTKTVSQFRAVQRDAVPEVLEAVKAGEVSIKAAEKISKLAPWDQQAALATPRDKSHEKPSTPKVKTIKPEVGASKEALAEMEERIAILAEENDRLNDRAAVHFMEGTEEEKAAYAQLLTELRAEVSALKVRLAAVTDSRDSLQTECNELRKQCGIYRSQLAKRAA